MNIRNVIIAVVLGAFGFGVLILGAGVAVVPLIPAELVTKYKQYAFSYFPPADYLAMEAIDTVRYHQDWSLPTDQSINQLASMFQDCWYEDDGEDNKIRHCRIRSLDEVADRLGFTADEKQLAEVYLYELNDLNH